ncbi:MAG TPA: acyl carrier protein [Acidimicrobiales bacterium]|nr:acyl carrier protein [Acidimicrobiales bacterium]
MTGYEEPGLKQRLRNIWQTVLDQEAVEDGDDFFDLGGDSLAMVYLMTEIDEAFGIELDVEELFSLGFSFDECSRSVESALSVRPVSPAR